MSSHWIRPHWDIEFSISRWNINIVAFSDRVIWLTKWSFHNVFLFSLSSVCWLAALRNLFKGGTKDWSQSNNVWLLYLTISLMGLRMLCIALLLLHMQSLSIWLMISSAVNFVGSSSGSSLLWSFMKFLWTSWYSSSAFLELVWNIVRRNVWFRISLR